MKKIMILGSGGMLGHIVYYYLRSLNKYNIVDASFPQPLHTRSNVLDVKDEVALESYIVAEKPDVIVNCIGILIKGSQSDPSNAIYINSYFPHRLAKILRGSGGKVIHVSTDCVFTGTKGKYSENDYRDADDTYGRSKALGELINNVDVTLRTSIVGPELKEKGEGLFHWFMQQTAVVKGFTHTYWGGVTTLELAKVIDVSITENYTGLIHVTNGFPISKYDLIGLFQSVFNKTDIELEPVEGKKTNKSLISIRKDLKHKVASYNQMISELKSFMVLNNFLYQKQYKL